MSSSVTFNLGSGRGFLAKLRWEIDSLSKSSNDLGQMVYHCLNAAWTAWHIHEWIWDDLSSNYHARVRLAQQQAIPPQDVKAKSLGIWAAETCSAIAVCQTIATAAKHVGFERALGVSTDVSATTVSAPMIDDVPNWDALFDVNSLSYNVYVPKVNINGKRYRMDEVLEDAFKFWERFCDEYGL